MEMYLSPHSTALIPSRKVSNVGDWFEDVMEHLHDEVDWIGATLIGGPDEKGVIKIIK